MKIRSLFWILLLGLTVIGSSCNNPFPGFKKTESGMYYKFHIKNDCDSFAKPGDLITFYMKIYNPDTVFTSDDMLNERQRMVEPRYPGDIFEALGMMCEGDSATFIFSADSINAYYPGVFALDSGSYMYTDIKMVKIFTPQMIENEEEELMKSEMEMFEKYRTDSLEGFTEFGPGAFFKQHKEGKGALINDSSIISLTMEGTTLDGRDFMKDFDKVFHFKLQDKNYLPFNWDNALKTMKEGAIATIVLTSPNAFGKRGLSKQLVKPYESVRLEIEILKVSANFREYEKYSIRQYLTKNNITQKPGRNGLYYIVETKGSGPLLKSKDKVKVHYTGYYLDNMRPFDSSEQYGEPIEVVIDESDVIKGWHEALKMMRVGEKGRLIIPSALGYGEHGMPPVIGPHSPLVFDIEVVEKL